MEYRVLKGFQVEGYAALEVGESGVLPYEADRLAQLVEQGYLEPATPTEAPVVAPVAPDEPVAEGRPHFAGTGEPTPGTWEAVWRDEAAKSATRPPKATRRQEE